MPFVRKTEHGQVQPARDSQKIFVGRADELHFFIDQILKPDDPTYNIVSLYGDGGVGKSTLLHRFIEEAATPDYREYCLTALVDERQATAASMLEKFAEQLHLAGSFKRALLKYREALRKFQSEQETMPNAVLQHAPDFAGAAVEGVPIFGPLLREGMKVTTEQVLKEFRNGQHRQDSARLEDPIGDLTRTFISELNRLADSIVTLGIQRRKRTHRILLIFDTFEQLAAEAAPWLLDYFLQYDISNHVVLVTAGRIPLAGSLPDDPKRWLPYTDTRMIHNIPLSSFGEEETRAYLEQRSITDPLSINRIWQLSHGLPLYLSLLTANPQHDVDPTADVVENFLRWIPENDELKRRLLLDAALFSRPFNQDELSALTYIPEQERIGLYRWLIKQPFILRSPLDGHYRYHELAQDLFSRHHYQSAPSIYFATRRMLAGYYQEHLDSTQVHAGKEYHRIIEWQDLSAALAQQLFLLPESASHFGAVEQLLEVYERTQQDKEVERVLRTIDKGNSAQQASPHARRGAHSLRKYILSERFSKEQFEASEELLEYIHDDSTFSPLMLARLYGMRGVSLRNQKRYRASLDNFNRALELDPFYTWAYGNRGITYRYMKQDFSALDDLNKALALDENQDWVYASRGEVYRHLGRYDQSLSDLNRALTLDPEYTQAYLSRARVYRILKQDELSLRDMDRAIALDPSNYRFYAQRGEALRALKQDQRALSDYTRALELYPEYAWAYATRALIHFQLENPSAALADLDQALKLKPDYPWAYAQRGRIYRHIEDYQHALADLDQALQLDPKNAWAYSHRGLTHRSLQQYELALADSQRALDLEPQRPRFYGRRAGAYLRLNKLSEAHNDYLKNSQLSPGDTWAGWMATWTALCLEGLQESNRAAHIAALEPIAAYNSEHYYSQVSQAALFWLRGKPVTALQQFKQAALQRPEAWDSIFWQGLLLSEQERNEGPTLIQEALKQGLPPVLLMTLNMLPKTPFYISNIQTLQNM